MVNHTAVSFIIPHKGRETFLQQTLQSISTQDFELGHLEIILVTQNTTISEEVLSYSKQLTLKVFYRPESETISALRNFGVAQSSSDYLAFLDADVYLSSNWINSMIECLGQDKSRLLVSAIQKNSDSAPPLERIRTTLSNATIDQNVNFLPGRNLFLKRETFELVGGFPEHLITCEDYYFTDKVNQLGSLYYTSAAEYIHLGEDKSFWDMYKKEIWRGQSNLLSIKGRRISLNEIPSFIIPIVIPLCLVLGMFSIIVGGCLPGLSIILLGLLPFFAYIIRLYRLKNNTVGFSSIVKFYTLYFPARAIGTVVGIFKSLNATAPN